MRMVLLAGIAAGGLGSVGCSTMNNTETGALVGGGTGAVAGAAIAGLTGNNPLAGAGIGAAAGGLGGALVGNSADKRDARDREVRHAAEVAHAHAQSQRLGVFDVIHLAQNGHDDTVIINQIRTTGSTYQLTPSDLDALKQNGVSPRVIAEMQNARAVVPASRVVREPATTVIYEPVYAYPPPVFVRPMYVPPPRPSVVFVGGYRHCR
jgi:outer membrane lipoprotein SlyB